MFKNVVNEIYNALLEPKDTGGTPKKTGHLRSNYLITIENTTDEVVGSPKNVNKSKRDQLKREFDNTQNLSQVKEIHINNSVDYGPVVNSRQGFREIALEKGKEAIRQGKIVK